MPIRITGMNSGLDTESIISALVSSYSTKKDKFVKAQTKLTWQQEAWSSLNSKIYSLYTDVGNLRYSSSWKMKSTKISDATKATVTSATDALDGTHTLKINKLAKAGYITGGVLSTKDSSKATSSSTLSDLGYTGGNGTITITNKKDGTPVDIAVDGNTKISDFVSKLKEAGVSASFDEANQRIFVSSKETGVDNDFTLVGSDMDGVSALSALGLNLDSATGTNSVYASTAKYAVYDGAGQYDAAATKTNFVTIQTALRDANINKANANSAKNASLEEIEYANAYKAVKDTPAETVAQWDDTLSAQQTIYDTASNNKADAQSRLDALDQDSATYETDKSAIEAEISGYETEMSNAQSEIDTALAAKNAYEANKAIVEKYEANEANATRVQEVSDAYAGGTLDGIIAIENANVTSQQTIIDNSDATIESYADYYQYSDYTTYASYGDADFEQLWDDSFSARVTTALSGAAGGLSDSTSTGAVRVKGQNAQITLDGADYSGGTNTFTINGLTITATGETAAGNELTITTQTDVQGMYDKIKDILEKYNEVVNEMMKLYNADSAKGYEPLTDDEKAEMSDTEIEKWESKIKEALLRHDTTLSTITNSMVNSMNKSYEVNGKKMSLVDLGIHTLGYLNAVENENYAYHIDGDSEDSVTSGKSDKLLAALNADPDSVVDFMQQLMIGVYDNLNNRMKSTTLSSAYKIYNDKEMASEYSDYTTTIKTWNERLTSLEDSYYEKFSAMETALAKLNSSSSALTGLMGS